MDISSLLGSLSEADMLKLKETAQQFFGSAEEEKPVKESFSFDPGILTGVAKFSELLNEKDERCNFIYALKPLLSESRRKKADDAVMMLKFMKIFSSLQENGL